MLQSERRLASLRVSLSVTAIQLLGGDAVIYALAARGGCVSPADVFGLDQLAQSRLGPEVTAGVAALKVSHTLYASAH